MSDGSGIGEYPLAETAPEDVRGPRGRRLDEITPAAVASGEVTIEDLRVTPDALRAQARIARATGRSRLAENFERAAELVAVPQDRIMAIYELLRPGRAGSRQALLDEAALLRRDHAADGVATLLERAAEHYHRRGLLSD